MTKKQRQSLFVQICDHIHRFPYKTFLWLIASWAVLIFIYRVFLFPLKLDTPQIFPISVLFSSTTNTFGLLSALLFILLAIFILWKIDKVNEILVVVGSFILVLLGNLSQGGIQQAFIDPFTVGSGQYYRDAIHITNWQNWLANFNQNQATLANHSQTHPPFAVLIHNLFLFLPGHHLLALSFGFSLISMFSIVLVMIILRLMNVEEKRRKVLLLLFALIPAINIYSIVSLDGVIMTTATLFLLGMIILIYRPKNVILGMFLIIVGFITTNLLTYVAGLFLIGIAGLFGVYEVLINRDWKVLISLGISLLLFTGIIFLMKYSFHYDHIQGFLTASKHDNPNGFRLFSDPLNYFLSRFEDVSELGVFLSIGVLSVVLNPRLLIMQYPDVNRKRTRILSLIMILTLCLLFASGAFRTGETARGLLFIYPYFLLLLSEVDTGLLVDMAVLAGLQTIIMQVCANFFW